VQKARGLQVLDHMWVEGSYFCRGPETRAMRFAFTNYGVSVGLQAVDAMPERIRSLNAYFETYRSGRIRSRGNTHVMHAVRTFPAV